MLKYILIPLIAVSAYANSWLLEPTISYVNPGDSKVDYYGMRATANYKTGEAFSVNAGRQFKNFKLYGTYDYTRFTANSISVDTPFGTQTQNISDEFTAQALLANVDYASPSWHGFRAIIGAGAGYAFSEQDSPIYEVHAAVAKHVVGWNISFGYAYRITTKEIQLAHKTIEQPDQARITFGLSKRF